MAALDSIMADDIHEEGSLGKKFVRADLIDLKSLDERFQRFLDSRELKQENGGERRREGGDIRERHDWEIDPSKLVIESVIGHGTFATVHRGIYDGQDVAVKLMEISPTNRAVFTKEIAVSHKLEHPNVTKFIGALMGPSELNMPNENGHSGMANVCCVLVEYLPGGTLKNFLIKNTRKKLPFKVVIQLALDLAKGLSYLHSKKIVHRDLKSENIVLDTNGTAKIADFGVARIEATDANEMTGVTGTFGYMAPEVLNGKAYNRKCDVYSFGICLWEIYCCDMPFADISFTELSAAVVHQNARPEIPRCCPSSIANIMKRCWDANSEKRPEMDDVIKLLEAIDTSKGGGMIPPGQTPGCFCFRKQRGP